MYFYNQYGNEFLFRYINLIVHLKGKSHPFKEVIKCNIGDCHAMGQKAITFLRQVAAVLALPELLEDPKIPSDAKERAKRILSSCSGSSVGMCILYS